MAVNFSAGVAPNPSVGKPRAISASAHAGRCEGCGAAIALTEKILLVSPSLSRAKEVFNFVSSRWPKILKDAH